MRRQLLLSLGELYQEVKHDCPSWTISSNGEAIVASQLPFYVSLNLYDDHISIFGLDQRLLLAEDYSLTEWFKASQRFRLLLSGELVTTAMEARL